MVPERLKTFFKKVKKRLSETKREDMLKFVAKEAVGAIPFGGSIIKDAIDEFSPDEQKEVINELKVLSENRFQEISEEVGVSVEYLKNVREITISLFEELRADHKEIIRLLESLIIIHTPEVNIPTIKDVLKKGDKGDFFKKEPERIDFEEGFIVERKKEVNQIIENMDKDNIQLVLGEPASGKSIILKNVGFKLTNENENKKVYFVGLKKYFRDEVKKYLENIPKINNEEAVFIVDDAHLCITDCEGLINNFKSKGKGRLIIGSRETSEIRGENPKETSPFESLKKTYIHSEDVTEEMIKRFFIKRKYNFSNERINTVSKNLKQYKKDLWFLSWALKAYKKEKDYVEEKEIYKKVRDSVRHISMGKDKLVKHAEDIFLPLSVFYRFEIPIERGFLEEQLGIDGNIVNQLIELSEIIETEEIGRKKMLSLNHSSIAELFYGTYESYPEFGKRTKNNILNKKSKDRGNLDYCLFHQYLTTVGSINAVSIITALSNGSMDKKRGITLLKMLVKDGKIQKLIKKGIEEEENICEIGHFFFRIGFTSQEAALELVNVIDIDSLSSKIEKEEDIVNIRECVRYIARANKEVGRKLLKRINLNVLSSKIDKEEDPDEIGSCIVSIAEASEEVGQEIVNRLKPELIDKLQKEGFLQWSK